MSVLILLKFTQIHQIYLCGQLAGYDTWAILIDLAVY